jgi:hypothetical protein
MRFLKQEPIVKGMRADEINYEQPNGNVVNRLHHR